MSAKSSSSAMGYRSLGRCGTRVSELSLGGWTTFGGSVQDSSVIDRILSRAFEAGINFFDIADVYANGRSESEMGAVLKKFPRHRLVLSSKVYFPMSDDVNDRGLGRKHIFESVEKSLQRLGTDYLDVYFCHRYDNDTPLEETVRAMDDLVHQGKILYWGTSEWRASQLNEAHELCREMGLYRPQVEQPEYNLIQRSRFELDAREATQANGMGVVIWSPLSSGLLTGKYHKSVPPPDSRLLRMDWLREKLLTEERLSQAAEILPIAERLGCLPSQLALAWTLHQPGISSVILGVSRPEQLEENLGALSLRLDSETLAELDRAFPATASLDRL